ncbi:MAG TPA: hypothetical protein VFW12_07790 [Candidatus Limnocylindria bacterium]|nr:hypothetical protein [Candidatus Limnocylindria bacterium]
MDRAGDRLVLEEFRLADGASHRAADLVLAATDPEGVPLLSSIADDRDVASVRCIAAGAAAEDGRLDHSTFEPLVTGWAPLRTYRPRVAESSVVRPRSYHLAVTESGINDSDPALLGRDPRPGGPSEGDVRPIDLLWIGMPDDSHAGLLVVLGDGGAGPGAAAAWPLPLSEALGVRIYRGSARS